jgi:hypothetical protein
MNDIIRDANFESGFEAGYRAIKGIHAALPAIPAAPATKANMTAFLMGLRRGVERATGKSIDQIRS